MTSYDSLSGNYYVWLVQRGKNNDKITLDLAALNLTPGTIASMETVGPSSYGEVAMVSVITGGKLAFTLRSQTVALITISSKKFEKKILQPSAFGYVSGGKNADRSLDNSKGVFVSLDAFNKEKNNVSFIRWDVADSGFTNAGKIMLRIQGRSESGNLPFRLHVYAIPGASWNSKDLTWNSAPQLDSKEALVKEVGQKAFIAGEITFTGVLQDHLLDVTALMKNHAHKNITFALVRETRQIGDDVDKGRRVVIKQAALDLY